MDNVWSDLRDKVANDICDINEQQKQKFYSGAFTAEMDFSHISPDWDYVIKKGFPGIIRDLEKFKKINQENEAAVSFYNNSLTVYMAVIDFILRLADLAEEKGTAKAKFTAENLRTLAISPPKTLAQAMQLTLIYYSIQMKLEIVFIRSLGGLDHLYYPLYKKDIESGNFTEEQLRELTRDFLWKINAMGTVANLPFYICGTDLNGQDATNDYTIVLLEEYRSLNIYDPKIHVMYHDDINNKALNLILEMIREGKNSFVFINTNAAKQALKNIGIEEEDAKRITAYGCYETSAEGTEVPCTCGGYINMAKAFELAINNGFDTITDKKVGLSTGEDFLTFDDFFNAVKIQLEDITLTAMNIISGYEPYYNTACPSPMMSATFKDSRERGIDLYCGGAKYNNTSVVGAGIATLTDSCCALKKIVFDEKKVTFKEFAGILQNNWKDNEKLRMYSLKACPKYGNNDAKADAIAKDIFEHFSNCINNRKNGRNGVFRCGLFSVDMRFYFGRKTAATSDGRKSGEPLSKNAAASIGQDRNGVTAFINSILKFDSSKIPDGCVADVVLHNSAVKDKEGMNAFKSLLLSYMNQGGNAIHFNVLNPENLKDAQKNPEKYKNLQIRLCGWNVRFVDLSREEQDEFILQAENR